MTSNIENKTVVITGGAQGIRFEISKKFLQRNAKKVIILDINDELGREACENLKGEYGNERVVFCKCDVVHDMDHIFEYIKDQEDIDILVNNAGLVPISHGWKNLVDVNFKYLIGWSLKFFEYARKDKGGSGGTIVNVASIFGKIVEPYTPVYHGTKFGVIGFTKSLGHRFNWIKTGVRVIAICPGLTETNAVSGSNFNDFDFADEAFVEYVKTMECQGPESVGIGAVKAFEEAESGTCWLISGGKPAVLWD